MWGQKYPERQVFPHFRLPLRTSCEKVLLAFWRGPTPLQYPIPDFSWPDRRSGYLLRDLQSESLPEDSVGCLLILKAQLPSCVSVINSTFVFCFRLMFPPERPSLWSSLSVLVSCLILPDNVYLALCHSCTPGYLSAGCQFLPGSALSLGLFLRLPAASCG
jgi:hypothetical protein